jgi:putative regulatory protein, FmdB family
MILYEFKCAKCGNFDAFAQMGAEHIACPQCGAKSSRVLTVPRFHLDGTDPAYSTAWDQWANDHERSAARGWAKVKEHGSER